MTQFEEEKLKIESDHLENLQHIKETYEKKIIIAK